MTLFFNIIYCLFLPLVFVVLSRVVLPVSVEEVSVVSSKPSLMAY